MTKERKRLLSAIVVLLAIIAVLFTGVFLKVYAESRERADAPDNEKFEEILNWSYKELQSEGAAGFIRTRAAKQITAINVTKGQYWWYGTGYARGNSGAVYRGWLTREFYIDGQLAYCLEPEQGTVPGGICSAFVNTGLGADLPRVIKGLYYLYGGPGYDQYKNAFGDLSALNLYAGAESVEEGYPQSDTARRFGVTHVALSVMFDKDNGVNSENRNTYKGLTAAERAIIDKVEENVASLPEIVIDPTLSFSRESLTGKWDKSQQVFKTETVKLNGSTQSKVTIPLEAGMTLVNTTTGAEGTGNVQIKGGDSFYLTSAAERSGLHYASGALSSNAVNTFTALVIDSSGSDEQAVGSWTYRSLTPNVVSISVKNQTIGRIMIQKSSAASKVTDGNDYYRLTGAVYGLFQTQTEKEVERIVLDKNGVGTFDYVVSADYFIQELEAPMGYLKNPTKYEVKSGDFGSAVNITRYVTDQPQYGRITLTKVDSETSKAVPQGAGKIAGAVYQVKDAAGAVIETLVVDESGKAATGSLPLGKYTVSEITASEGYLLDKTIYTVELKSSDAETQIITREVTSKEQVKRGDLELIKVSAGDMGRLTGVSFAVTSLTTGESIVLITDENGYASTAAETQPTGALPYDTYRIEEMRGDANAEYDLIPPFNIVISRDSHTVDLGTLINEYTTVYLHTTAQDDSTSIRLAFPAGEVTIVDTVEYSNLVPGKEYTVRGTLIDKGTGRALTSGGMEITARKVFTASEPNGTVDVIFTFDAGKLAGWSVVVYEKLYSGSRLAASHEDIHAEGQTILFLDPRIGTAAREEATQTNQAFAAADVKIIDRVEYADLIAGKEYTVKGQLMDAETGSPLVVDDIEITAEKTFTAETASGCVELEFEIDARALTDKSIVVFEDIYYQGVHIAAHADIKDLGQTIEFPRQEIGTAARGGETGGNQAFAKGETTVIDTVEYQNLIVGQEYVVKGVLMNKQTGERLLIDDAEVMAEQIFIPAQPDGFIELAFTFDASALAGTTIVVFETLYHEQLEVAVHADLADEAQTIEIPDISIGTSARNAETGDNNVFAKDKVTIIDTVEYRNLIVGQEYTVKGILMDKETGEPLLANDEEVIAEAVFMAESENGRMDLAFVFDAAGLAGKTTVIFEYLYHGTDLLADHTDLNDQAQTIDITAIPDDSPQYAPRTGDTTVLSGLFASMIMSAIVIGVIIRRKGKVSKKK